MGEDREGAVGDVKNLKKRHQNPDPEMLRNLQLLNKIEILNMMREMGIVQPVEPENSKAGPLEGEKKK